jgi:hypothetical protein
LWTRLQAEEKEDMKAKEGKLRAEWAKFDTEQEKWKANVMKAYEEKWMAEQKTNQESGEAERKAYEKRMAKRKADQERGKAERKPTRRTGCPSGKLTKKKGRLKGQSTEKWRQGWKLFTTKQSPTR